MSCARRYIGLLRGPILVLSTITAVGARAGKDIQNYLMRRSHRQCRLHRSVCVRVRAQANQDTRGSYFPFRIGPASSVAQGQRNRTPFARQQTPV